MSDSEDEAFQSADEGENQASSVKPKEPPLGPDGKSKKQQKRNRKKGRGGQKVAEKDESTVEAGPSTKTVPNKDKTEEAKTSSKEDPSNNKTDEAKTSSKAEPNADKTEKSSSKDESSLDNADVVKSAKHMEDKPSQEDTTLEKIDSVTSEGNKDSEAQAPAVSEGPESVPKSTPAESSSKSKNVIAEQPGTLPTVEAVSPEKPTEQHQSVLNKLSDAAKPSGAGAWGGWSSWGSSILSTASSSVSTFTQQVGEGFNTVLETVESTLGVPDPVELAKQDRMAKDAKEPDETPNGRSECSTEEPEEVGDEVRDEVKDEVKDEEDDNQSSGGKGEASGWAPWGGWGLSEVTKAVGETGKNLVSGGLDVLETIGKTTYNAIAEGDHGLKNTLKKTGQKPNLSQILRDAKDEHEERSKLMEEYEEARKANFGALFDENNGLVHLEALEQVSTQCDSKVQSLLGTMSHGDLNTLKKDLIAIKDKFEVEEDSDEEEDIEADAEHTFTEQCKEIMVELGLPLTSDRLAQSFNRCRAWLKDCQEEMQQGVKMSPKEVHRVAIQSMAELTANSVQQFHKVSQLLQMTANGPLSIHVNRADCLSRLTKLLCTEVEHISVKFTSSLNSFPSEADQSSEINPLVTNVYLEASNSKTYIQDAFRLLLPVVQHTALLAYSREKQEKEES